MVLKNNIISEQHYLGTILIYKNTILKSIVLTKSKIYGFLGVCGKIKINTNKKIIKKGFFKRI